MSSIKIGSDWRNVNGVFVRIGNDWRTVTESYIKIGPTWTLTSFSTGPQDAPQMTHNGFGQFRIVNPQPNLIYEAEFVGGDSRFPGSIQFSNNVFTLGSHTSAYNVYSRFVPNGPRSPAGYMERRRIVVTYNPCCSTFTPGGCTREVDNSYPASSRDETRVDVQGVSNCAGYSCGNVSGPFGPNSSNECTCFNQFTGSIFVVGDGGRCPPDRGYFICNGNRCCVNYSERVWFCPNGGNLVNTTCVKIDNVPVPCDPVCVPCNIESPPPLGFNRSPGEANIQGEWWKITR
jgi:hypothetical protein